MRTSFWPTAAQRELIVTVLADDDAVATAWERARVGLVLDELEPGSFGVLPLVYRSLERAGVDDPLLERLKGIWRSTWAKNGLLLERTRETFEALEGRGVNARLIGGLAATLRFYDDQGGRPTRTIDVLVRPEDRPRAVEALDYAGWAASPGGSPLWLTDVAGSSCVLWTQLAPDFGPDVRLFDPAGAIDVRGTSIPVPAPTDQLLGACVTGARARRWPNIAWVLDIALAAHRQIDWERLTALAAAHDQALRVRKALEYVSTLPGVSIPADALQRLETTRTTGRARIAYALASRSARAAAVIR